MLQQGTRGGGRVFTAEAGCDWISKIQIVELEGGNDSKQNKDIQMKEQTFWAYSIGGGSGME